MNLWNRRDKLAVNIIYHCKELQSHSTQFQRLVKMLSETRTIFFVSFFIKGPYEKKLDIVKVCPTIKQNVLIACLITTLLYKKLFLSILKVNVF